jgi:nitrogen fixation protein NifZ
MGLAREQDVEIFKPPAFRPGEKVQSLKNIRNDGTVRGREIGDIIVKKGDVGYVRDVGTFLQQFFIYAVEWIDRGTIVGMRAKELVSVARPQAVCGSNAPNNQQEGTS